MWMNAASPVPATADKCSNDSFALFQGLFEIAVQPCEIAEKRKLSLALIGQALHCQCAVWSWGYSQIGNDPVTPVAILDWGMSPEVRTRFIQFGLHSRTDAEFRIPIRERAQRADCVTTRRQDLMDDSRWARSNMRSMVAFMGCDEWLHSVQQPRAEVWATIMLFRTSGNPPFAQRDSDTLQFVMSTVPWLDADRSRATPAHRHGSLTARQRTVMLMLLDGMTRKAIAANLQIHEDTVGDHIKAIFKHFRVRSVTELAAVFLQSK